MNTLNHDFDEVSPSRLGAGEIEARGERADRIQGRVAEKLRQTADSLFGNPENNSPLHATSDLGSKAGSWLNDSADYIEKIEPEKLKADISNQVRRNPGASLLLAGAAGLILGAIFRRR